MNIFEKVSKGLECCISLNGGPMDHDCKECPYKPEKRPDELFGYNSVEGFKSLIDEIREIAIKGVQNE